MRVGVIGGGITGLVCAYYLVRHGYRPIVFESRPYPGARGPKPNLPESEAENARAAAPAAGYPLDPFPVTLLRSDTATCGLIADLGLNQELQWHVTRAGVHSEGGLYPLSSWLDILRFERLPLIQRLRAARLAFTGIRMRTYARPLDAVRARDWFVEAQGEAMYEALWRPSLAARFGPHHVDDMPAYVAWQFFREEMTGSSRMVGALRGGVASLYRSLARALVEQGGELRLNTRIQRLEGDERTVLLDVGHGRVELDLVISAIKLPALAEIADGEFAASFKANRSAPKLQRVTSVRLLRRGHSPLQGYYRMLDFDRDAAFRVMLDGTGLTPAETRRDRSVTYLLRLDPESGPGLPLRDSEARRLAIETLRKLDGDISPSSIEEPAVFRWKSPDAIWGVDALENKIPPRLDKSPVYICTAAQAYPKAASLESSIMLARDCVGRALREHDLR